MNALFPEMDLEKILPKGISIASFEKKLRTPELFFLEQEGYSKEAIEKEYGSNGEIYNYLARDISLIDRINEASKMLELYKLTFEKVAKKINSTINFKHYKDVLEYEPSMYARYKPIKDYEYTISKLFHQYDCPWCPEWKSSFVFNINRPETAEEESLTTNWMMINQMWCIYEDDRGNPHPECIKEWNQLKVEDKTIFDKIKEIEKVLGPSCFTFTDILPHLVEKHHFFPNDGRYRIDIPFFLKAIGLEK